MIDLVRVAQEAVGAAAADVDPCSNERSRPVHEIPVLPDALGDDAGAVVATNGTRHKSSLEDRPHRLSGGLRAVGGLLVSSLLLRHGRCLDRLMRAQRPWIRRGLEADLSATGAPHVWLTIAP
jgi:hypothetical protein